MQPEPTPYPEVQRDTDEYTMSVAGHAVDPSPLPMRVVEPTQDPVHRRRGSKLGTVVVICLPAIILLLLRLFLFGMYVIPSGSMENTILPGDRVITTKLTPGVFALQRGDIVVFKDPANWLQSEEQNGWIGDDLIKRLIGLPGDTVECRGGGAPITINGVPIDESAYLPEGEEPSSFPFSVTVTPGHIFVLGDNRSHSADSRYHQDDGAHGLVPISDVVGVALVTYWPVSRWTVLDAHHEVFDKVPDRSAGQ